MKKTLLGLAIFKKGSHSRDAALRILFWQRLAWTILLITLSLIGAVGISNLIKPMRTLYLPGELDLSFNGNGKTTVQIGSSSEAQSVVIQSTGKIVTAGYSIIGTRSEFALARFNRDGSKDNSFGKDGNGTTSNPVGSGDAAAVSVVVQSDDKLVVAGYTGKQGAGGQFAVARYTSEGLPDTSFGSQGTRITTIAQDAIAYAVAIQPSDNKIVAAGYCYDGRSANFALVRYTHNGQLDSSFGTNGIVCQDFGNDEYGHAVVIESDGSILVGGGVDGKGFGLAHYKTSGQPDKSFGTNGLVITPIGSVSNIKAEIRSLAIQSDKKIVAAGYASNGVNFDFALARYNPDGQPDKLFGTAGTVTTPIGTGDDQAWSVGLTSDGKIVAAGYSYNGSKSDFAIARYSPSGLLDSSFASTGKKTTPIGTSSNDRAWSIAIQTDSKILVAGSTYDASMGTYSFALARYLGDPPSFYRVNSRPVAVVAKDLNGDDWPDLAVANYDSNNISIFFNNGDGTLTEKVSRKTNSGPTSIAVADFNGDDKLDLAVTNAKSDNVSILLNNGNGTFADEVAYKSNSTPESVAVGDFNGDNKIDLAVVNSTSNNVSIFLNKGDGTFADETAYRTNSNPQSVAVGDFNGDGKPDLAVANYDSNNVMILFNIGNGKFVENNHYKTNSGPTTVVVADFDGNGSLDLAVTNKDSNNVSVFLNKGDGTFADEVAYRTNLRPMSLAVGDFNGDGKTDLAVANAGSNNVTILINNGSGKFAAEKTAWPTNSGPWCVAVADFNGDGRPDIAVANQDSHNVSVLINTVTFDLP